MPIPTVVDMLRPILALAAEKPIKRREAGEAMNGHFGLTPEEQQTRIPSGGLMVPHRAGWAMTFLTKAALVGRVAEHTYAATDFGREFLAAHPDTITVADLKQIKGWKEAWKSNGTDSSKEPPLTPDGETPLEAIDRAVGTLHKDVRQRLLEAILQQSPLFFEKLVLDVLIAMGYGGSRTEAAQHLGQSNDEGIDGRINQDPLGLDQIMVQAKRYAPDHPIDRKTIQAFIGSLAGQGVTKGVFITTSSFASTAKEFVLRGSNTKVVLIDGDALLDLMMRHKIGVRVERQVELLDLDQNYFEDAE